MAFSLLGFQLSAYQEVSKLEVKVFPDRTLYLSAVDNGDRQIPEGLAFLRKESTFEYRPVVIRVIQVHDRKGTAKLFLRGISRLERSSQEISAVPSSVRHGSFLIGARLRVSRPAATQIAVEGWTLPRLGGDSVDAAVAFLRAFRSQARKFELKKAGAGSGRWLSPPKPSAPSFLFQVLESLVTVHGAAIRAVCG
jgi:hypothetical protein